jgi:hypothetical protein
MIAWTTPVTQPSLTELLVVRDNTAACEIAAHRQYDVVERCYLNGTATQRQLDQAEAEIQRCRRAHDEARSRFRAANTHRRHRGAA